MALPIWHGETIVLVSSSDTYDFKSGQTIRLVFEGDQSGIQNKAAELQQLRYNTEVTYGNGSAKWTLVATISAEPTGATESDLTTWELVPNAIEQSIYETGRSYLDGVTSKVKAAIEAKVKNPQNENLFIVPGSELNNEGLIQRAFHIYALKQAGIDGRRIYGVTLRRTINVNRQYNINWETTDVNKVMSKNTLLSKVPIPTSMYGILPSTYAENDEVTLQQYGTTLEFYYGWLEGYPTYQVSTADKYQLSQEWIWNKWSVGDNGMYDFIG